jgi:L-cysteine/cystine lyase
MLWVDPAWLERLDALAPAYGGLDVPAAGLDANLAPGARRYDLPSQDLATLAAAVGAYDVLAEAGLAEAQATAIARAARLADTLRDAGHHVVARGDSTLVSWHVDGGDAVAVAVRDRLAAEGIVIRDLPGAGRLRASVGAWNDDEDVQRLVTALGSR